MTRKLLLIALAGGLGTVTRYGLAGLTHRVFGSSFPWGTLAVNTTGCFLAGLLWTLFQSRWPVSGETRVIVLMGFFGAFTTFSAFVLETGELIRTAQWLYAGANVLFQLSLGTMALFAGIFIARLA